jgi:hypothetical protein
VKKLFKSSPRREAAWIRVKELLLTKERGDTLTVDEIDGAGAPFGLDSTMRGRIKRWFARERGIELISVRGDGYRLATADEHVDDVARGHQRRRMHHTKRVVRALHTAPDKELTGVTLVRRDAMMGRELHTLQVLKDNEKEYRKLSKASKAKELAK